MERVTRRTLRKREPALKTARAASACVASQRAQIGLAKRTNRLFTAITHGSKHLFLQAFIRIRKIAGHASGTITAEFAPKWGLFTAADAGRSIRGIWLA